MSEETKLGSVVACPFCGACGNAIELTKWPGLEVAGSFCKLCGAKAVLCSTASRWTGETPTPPELVEFELEVLRGLANLGPMPIWGAALSEALEHLHSSGYVYQFQNGKQSIYRLTKKGKDRVK